MLSASLVTSSGNCGAAVSKITCRKLWLAVTGIALRLTITTSAQGGSATSARTTAAPTCPVPPMIKTRNAIFALFSAIVYARFCCRRLAAVSARQYNSVGVSGHKDKLGAPLLAGFEKGPLRCRAPRDLVY